MTHIMKIHKERKNEVDNEDPSIISYTILGKHNGIDDEGYPLIDNDSDKVYAQHHLIINRDGHAVHKYLVRRGRGGYFFNPIGMYESNSNKNVAYERWSLKEVLPKVFNLYLQFLKTKNVAWLRNAEREAI